MATPTSSSSQPQDPNNKNNNNDDDDNNPAEEKADQKDLNWYLPLYKAALKGDWKEASRFFVSDPDAVTAKITKPSETALHIAVGTGRAIHFVERLVGLMSPTDLALTDKDGDTALSFAAIVGNTKAAKILVRKNPELTQIRNDDGRVPLHKAAQYGHRGTVLYLLSVTRDQDPTPFADKSGVDLLNLVIVAGFYDVAFQLVQRYPKLAALQDERDDSPLRVLARKASAFASGSRLSFWERFIYSCVPLKFENEPTRPIQSDPESSDGPVKMCSQFFRVCQQVHAVLWNAIINLAPRIKHIHDTKLMHQQTLQLVKCICMEVIKLDNLEASKLLRAPLFTAAELGVHEIVAEIVECYPFSIWFRNGEKHNIFHLAVIHRKEKVFNLIYQMSSHKHFATQLRDNSNNNILHLAGKLAPSQQLSSVSGAALQVQRELQWFKEVEKFVQPSYKERKNKDRKTPGLVFTEEHRKLIKEGEQWLKDTANSCMVVGTLIATVVFAAAITVPGGNNDADGIPILSKARFFIIFVVSDALSLFSSSTSVLMFLSILTSRYAEGDFLFALPKRLIIGLITLFISISSMMVAFSATVVLVFGQPKAWFVIPIASLACVPVTLFVSLQFPLLVDMVYSTYGPGIFHQQNKTIIH